METGKSLWILVPSFLQSKCQASHAYIVRPNLKRNKGREGERKEEREKETQQQQQQNNKIWVYIPILINPLLSLSRSSASVML